MYAVSDAFHEAVRNSEKQIPLMIFSDAVFSSSDINLSRGINFNDRFNLDESIKIGQSPSNTISFSLFNDAQLLNDYGFGDFLATIGVRIGADEFKVTGSCYLRTGYATYAGYVEAPFLTRNGKELDDPPAFPVSCMMAYNGRLWVFSNDGQYMVYDDSTGNDVTATNPVNTFMRWKMSQYEGMGYYYNGNSRIMFVYDDLNGIRERYEFCPLGRFVAERPNASGEKEISLTCYDLMQRFDQDMPSGTALGITYPVTIGNLFKKMCDYVQLPYRTVTFINSTATVDAEPEDFSQSTMRTVLEWIAEAASSNVRIDRDGYVILDWIRTTGKILDEGDYSDFQAYWYQTKKVTKLYNRNTVDTTENTVGTGSEAYLIQDNPLLANAT